MKVLQINIVLNYGSTGHIVEDIGDILIEKGHESHCAYGRKKRSSNSMQCKFGTDMDFAVHYFSSLVLGLHGRGPFASVSATKRLIKYIETLRPDIIHLHNIHGYYVNYEILFDWLKNCGIPVVWTLHDCWAYTGHCAYYTFAGCDRWNAGCGSCPQKGTYPKSMFFDRSRRNLELKKKLFGGMRDMTLVTPSEWLLNEVKKSWLGKYSGVCIPNGIDTELFCPQKKSEAKNKFFTILGVANVWSQRKGLDDFLRLSKRLGPDERIILVGVSKEQQKILPQNIEGIERTESQKELVRLYSEADVYFNPSVEETQGLTTIESMACGTPVIVYNKTAVPECVDSTSGFVVEAGNLDSVCARFREIKNMDSEKIGLMRKACREHAVTYDKKVRLSEYVKLYEKILSGSRI